MRSKYGTYPEYHTSLDDLSLVTPAGLSGAFSALQTIISMLENNFCWRAIFPCEPQLGKRNLYPTVSRIGIANHVRTQLDLLAYADGKHDLLDLADRVGLPAWECADQLGRLEQAGVIERLIDSDSHTIGTFPAL